MSLRLKHMAVSTVLSLVHILRQLFRAIAWIIRLILIPCVVILKWALKPVAIFVYGVYLKAMARLKRSAFMHNKVLFIFGNRYFIHVIVVIITMFVASTNLLQAKESGGNEIFAQDSALYSIVNPDGGFDDEIVETGLITTDSSTTSYIETDGAMVATIPNLDPNAKPTSTIGDQLALLENKSAVVGGSVLETKYGVRSDVTEYKVKKDDTIGDIADRFGLTVNTLLWANTLTSSSYIRPGDTLKIPPASGVIHVVASGDTLEKIVEKYKGDLDETIKVNSIGDDHQIAVGTEIVVVDGTPPPPPPPPVQRYYSSYGNTSSGNVYRSDYYAPVVTTGQKLNWPVGCRSTPSTYWGHGLARDISCPMGTPIYAAESGTVYIRNSSGYGSGYGLYIDMVHPNGMGTRYAHMSAFNVSNGQYVERGQVIGFVGSTGRSSGPHLHFEVTVNGVKQEPLYYIQ